LADGPAEATFEDSGAGRDGSYNAEAMSADELPTTGHKTHCKCRFGRTCYDQYPSSLGHLSSRSKPHSEARVGWHQLEI
jgi:hypothetical protein